MRMVIRPLIGLAALIFAPVAFVVAFVIVWIGYVTVVPVSNLSIPVPFEGVEVNTRVWSSFSSDGSFDMKVRSPGGTLTRHLWEDWGPAQRSNYYRTKEGWLAVFGAGELAALVEFPADGPPRYPLSAKNVSADALGSADWEYLGAAVGNGRQQVFLSPAQAPECVDLFGVQGTSLRVAHEKDFC